MNTIELKSDNNEIINDKNLLKKQKNKERRIKKRKEKREKKLLEIEQRKTDRYNESLPYLLLRHEYLTNKLKNDGDLVCHYCGRKHLEIGYLEKYKLQLNRANPKLATIDHKIPKGLCEDNNDVSNWLVSCKRCNQEKNRDSYEDYISKKIEKRTEYKTLIYHPINDKTSNFSEIYSNLSNCDVITNVGYGLKKIATINEQYKRIICIGDKKIFGKNNDFDYKSFNRIINHSIEVYFIFPNSDFLIEQLNPKNVFMMCSSLNSDEFFDSNNEKEIIRSVNTCILDGFKNVNENVVVFNY